MTDLSPAQAARALDLATAALPAALQDVLRFGAVRMGANAVGRMRDAKGEGRRDPDDNGPLRIVTGTHARATGVAADRLGSGSRGAINRIRVSKAKAVLEKGYDTAFDKGAINEVWDERRKYWTLAPAIDDEEPAVRRRAEEVLTKLLYDAVGTARA